MEIIPKGTLVAISEGEYSDYRIEALGEAVANLDLKALEKEFLALPEAEEGTSWDTSRKFLRWLIVDKELLTQRPAVGTAARV